MLPVFTRLTLFFKRAALVVCLLLVVKTGALASGATIDSLRKDSLLSVINLSSHKDSAKINEVVVFKLALRKDVPITLFNTLYLNGIKVDHLTPWKVNEDEHMVYFKLGRSVQYLASEFLTAIPTDKVILPVSLGIGNEKQVLLQYKEPFQLQVNQNVSMLDIWLMSAILIVLVFLGLKFDILKDDNNLYYSLGRTQMLYWTLLFTISYLYLCGESGTLPDIPSSILVILGISAATTAASKILENNNKDVVPITPQAKSEGFFLDILSDGSSINIQRFQNVVFNLLFGIIFVQKTISVHLMPDFDNNVLLMLGISAGTYAGMKATEATKIQNKPAPQVNSETEPPAVQPQQQV